MGRESLFNRIEYISQSIRLLGGIFQNDVSVSKEELSGWCEIIDFQISKLHQLKEDVLEFYDK